MKKTLAILVVAIFCSSVAMATTLDGNKAPGFNPTKSVTVDYDAAQTPDNTAPYNVYSIASSHQSGDRMFATTSVYGGINYVSVSPGEAAAAPATPGSPTDSSAPAGFGSKL